MDPGQVSAWKQETESKDVKRSLPTPVHGMYHTAKSVQSRQRERLQDVKIRELTPPEEMMYIIAHMALYDDEQHNLLGFQGVRNAYVPPTSC